MTTLSFFKKKIQGRAVGPASDFPAISLPLKYSVSTELDEDDGLFINYGRMPDSLPYTMQDNYDGPMEDLEFDAAVLENQHIRAEVVISLGGRLWSIYDKDAKRDLILDNHQLLPGNLAIRNAWFAGGVEWNIGRRGHDAQTCSPRFAGSLTDDNGSPVLRIYEFSRDTLTPFQLDFMLPDDSKFLFVRGRILNQSSFVQPMYWWSNIAVEEAKGARVIVPTDETYANAYHNGHHALSKIKLPFGEGFDSSYPTNFPCAKDHFYKIPEDSRKYETVFFPDGYGIAHCSTRRQQGRKLFVWGQGRGGSHWQRRLMAPDCPDYIEIQAGLAFTQQECLPMPPKTAWEWMEAYGPIQLPPEVCFGDWNTAVNATTEELDKIMPEAKLDSMLASTKQSVALKKADMKISGSGWAALEQLLRKENFAPQLDFGTTGPEQAEWVDLLQNGEMDDLPPKSFMVQDEWFELLLNAKKGWKVLYHLALNYYRRKDPERAMDCINKSIALNRNPWNIHALAYFLRFEKKVAEATALFSEVIALRNNDSSLAKDALKSLLILEQYQPMVEAISKLTPEVRQKPQIQFLYASAIAHLGKLDEAEAIVMKDGGMEVPDIREGEISTSELFIYIQIQKAKLKGIALEAKDVDIPYALDLRMS